MHGCEIRVRSREIQFGTAILSLTYSKTRPDTTAILCYNIEIRINTTIISFHNKEMKVYTAAMSFVSIVMEVDIAVM